MRQNIHTREKLLLAAKEEFLDKGYLGASLRSICKKAGVTTGALYFFFQDKNELFGSLVKEPLENMHFLMQKHYEGEMKDMKKSLVESNDASEDREAAIAIVDYLYQNYDAFVLLLLKSAGSQYENCLDAFISITEAHYRNLSDEMAKRYKTSKMDDYTIHWLAHLQIFFFVQLVEHNVSRKDALKQIAIMVKFMISGWLGIWK